MLKDKLEAKDEYEEYQDRKIVAGRTVSVRWGLFAAFASLVMLITGSIMTISLIKTSQMADNLAIPLIESVQREVATKLRGFFDPITKEIAIAHGLVTGGLVKRYDTEALKTLFLPKMALLPQSGSMMVSDMTGYEFLIMKGAVKIPDSTNVEPQYSTREFRRDEWGKRSIWTLWNETGEKKVRQWEKDLSWTKEDVLKNSPSGTNPNAITEEDLIYDPRVRIWHEGPRSKHVERSTVEIAQNLKEAIYWTEIDLFFTSKTPGLNRRNRCQRPLGRYGSRRVRRVT